MFNYDKFIGSKFYSVFDHIYKFTILNILIVLTNFVTFMLFGFLPSLISAAIVLKDTKENKTVPIFKSYFYNFRYIYKKAFTLNIGYLITMFVFGYNIYYFYMLLSTNDSFFTYLALFMFILSETVVLLMFLQTIYVFIFFPYLDNTKILKYSILYVFTYLKKSLLVIGLTFLTYIIGSLFFYLVPIVIISIYLYLLLRIFYIEYKQYITSENNYVLDSDNIFDKVKSKQKLI